jgi:aryl-alcohol dehydrogenase-like predicted oxidoreductase
MCRVEGGSCALEKVAILNAACDSGMGISPWGVIGGGRLRSDEEEKQREENGEAGRMFTSPDWKRTESERKVSNALEKVGKEVGGVSVSAGKWHSHVVEDILIFYSVAIAYVLHKAPYVFPIIGGRKVEQLHDNMKALEISLSKEQIEFLEEALPFSPGFPSTVFVS